MLRTVPPEDVFNLPLSEGYLVIDTRAEARYCVASAVSLPRPDGPEATWDAKLAEFVQWVAVEVGYPDHPSPCVVYGDGDSATFTEWLCHRLLALKASAMPLVVQGTAAGTGDPRRDYDDHEGAVVDDSPQRCAERFMRHLVERTGEVWVIDGGFAAFAHAFPCCCGPNLGVEDVGGMPALVAPRVYVGHRAVWERRQENRLSQDAHTLRALGITHVVCAGELQQRIEDVDGLVVLSCAVSDSPTQRMGACWQACAQFISRALEESPSHTVLIQLHGRSRSAGVAVAWLVSRGSTFADALATVRRTVRFSLDPKLLGLNELESWRPPSLLL